MQVNMYVIYDTKAKFYNKPFFMQNDQIAQRAFTDLANDPQTDICKHPTDFQLYKVGTYEDATATITSNPPIHMANAHELKKAESIYKDMIAATEPKNKPTDLEIRSAIKSIVTERKEGKLL
ncbi:MAG: nonstructural protein [Microviridae sp.]|nr:MAG: nonstructural protein [Microviridae sp.]